MAPLLTTGVDSIDRELDGGLEAGSLLVISAPPESQSEPLLHAFMRERPSAYITTLRTRAPVVKQLDEALSTDNYDVNYAGVDTPIHDVDRILQQVDGQANVIVDTMNPVERTDDRERYVKFLNQFKTHLVNTSSLGILHCTRSDDTPEMREVTLSIADVVWKLGIEINGTSVENILNVPKFRGGETVDETIKLELGEEVAVDTSRDIA